MRMFDILKTKGAQVYTISPDVNLADLVSTLVQHNCGSLVVCNGDRMVGIITERDILKVCAGGQRDLAQVSVRAKMSVNVTTGSPEDDVSHTMGIMTKKRIRHLLILKEGKLAGMITIGDVVKAQHAQLSMENHYLKEYIQG